MTRFKSALPIVLATAGLLAGIQRTSGHEFFAGCIQHGIEVVAGAEHIDVKVQLRFFEEGSAHERDDMDADEDGRVTRQEIKAYLTELEPVLAKALVLRVQGEPISLLTLYPPQVDLLGNKAVGRGHHLLTLHFFAKTPVGLPPGAELVVEDRLWPAIAAVGTLQARGIDGCRLVALPLNEALFRPARGKEARLFKARVLASPARNSSNSPQEQ